MGKSFFTGTDAQLFTGSGAFSEKITATPTAFGLTAAQATAYAALNSAYAAAYMAAEDPATRTKGKVQAKRDAKIALKSMASDLAKIITGTATVTNEQKSDLGISVRAVPTPVPPPEAPTDFKVTLNGDGSLDLSWKCATPRGATGTMYQVWRRIGPVGEFQYVGGVGQKSFIDATVPAGTAQVTYQLQAVRSTGAGPWSQVNVNFGAPPAGGAMTAQVGDVTTMPKMAA